MTEFLIPHFEYTKHASMLLVDACKELPEEELTRDMKASHVSILGTLQHIYFADRIWLARFEGTPTAGLSDPGENPSLAELERSWPLLLDRFKEYVTALGDSGVRGSFTFRNLKGVEYTMPRWQCLLHVVNHASVHRGQVVTLLRQLGYVPPSTDLVYYYRK